MRSNCDDLQNGQQFPTRLEGIEMQTLPPKTLLGEWFPTRLEGIEIVNYSKHKDDIRWFPTRLEGIEICSRDGCIF